MKNDNPVLYFNVIKDGIIFQRTQKTAHPMSLLLAFLLVITVQPTPLDSVIQGQPHTKTDSVISADTTIMIPTLKAGDQAFVNIDYSKAQSIYEALLNTDSTNADILWRLARLNVCIGDAINPDQKEKRDAYYEKAIDYARKCIAIDPNKAEGHTWLGASLGVMADNLGSKQKIKIAKEIKKELDLAIKLNPNDDIAYSILGSYYHAIANISWFERMLANTFLGSVPEGSYEEAEVAFKKAIALNPNLIRHYHEFALLYLDWGKEKEAVALLKQALTKPVKMKNDRRRRREIKALIREYADADN